MAGGGAAGVAAALAGGLLCAALLCGCAGGDLVAADGRIVHRREGFSVPDPERTDPAWRRTEVKRSVLAYEHPGGARMSLRSDCGSEPVLPQVLARGLLIGVDPHVLRQSGPVAVGEFPGWSQLVDVEEDGRVVRLKTVTLVAGHCSFDFLMVAGDDFEALEPGFDAWWAGFQSRAAPPAPAPQAAP